MFVASVACARVTHWKIVPSTCPVLTTSIWIIPRPQHRDDTWSSLKLVEGVSGASEGTRLRVFIILFIVGLCPYR